MITPIRGLADQPPQHHAVEAEGEGDHGSAGEAERGDRAEPRAVRADRGQARAVHEPFAEREVDHARGLVDYDEGERDEGVDRAGEHTVHDEGDEEEQGVSLPPVGGGATRSGRRR